MFQTHSLITVNLIPKRYQCISLCILRNYPLDERYAGSIGHRDNCLELCCYMKSVYAVFCETLETVTPSLSRKFGLVVQCVINYIQRRLHNAKLKLNRFKLTLMQ